MKRLKAIESGELRDGVLPLGITYDVSSGHTITIPAGA
ncbi:hypothetical protein HaLaN_15829 [Haematococcus lacustris]|uniref:Uncharacterized protein n=1 Tax=Haematococcus lacustris TaxID=44745 RepID=A0A699ZC16_HAELA|nr:hypothetical protein HaLaN_15829 [Haematococcus lacustris]